MKNKKSLLGIGLIGLALALFGVMLTKFAVTNAAGEMCELGCNQNYYSSGNKCVECDAGYTAPLPGIGGRDRCTRTCSGATHVATTGGNCEECPDGKASSYHTVSGGTVSFCIGCVNKPSIGAYYTAPGSGDKYSCDWDCESGFEKSVDGNSCVCPQNTYYDPVSNSCLPCQNGYTSAPGLGGVNSCQKRCAGGTHVESPRGSCTGCGIGSGRSAHTQLATGTSVCSGCINGPTNKDQYILNVGYYYTTNGTSINSCTWECSSGYYLSGTYPNGKCIPCTGGYYTPDGSGATSVEQCKIDCGLNHHVAEPGSGCDKCPSNAQTTPPHSVSQGRTTDCGELCPANTYLSGTVCVACPGGRKSYEGSTSVNDCFYDCGECGYVENLGDLCVSCPAGKSTQNPIVYYGGTSECNNFCQNAPTAGSEYVSGPACCTWQCRAGYYLNSAKTGCNECPYGFSEAGSDSVYDCVCGVPPDNGQYDETCHLICDAGYYKNSAGTGCTPCPSGSSMTGSDSVDDCKEAQCGPAQGPSYVNEPELLCNNIANSTGVTAGTDTYSWQCTYVNHTVSCSTHRIYSCGTVPTGAGVKTGAKTREYGYTPGTWTYTGSDTPGACEWTCKSGYEKSGNTCVAKSAQCGPAQGPSYASTPSTALLCNMGSSTGAREDPSGCSYSWNCSNLDNSVSCSTQRVYSCGTAPTGAGVVTGEKTRTCSDTIHTWTYTDSATPGACQWTCEAGYISGTNKCIVQAPQCGTSNGKEFTTAPTDGLCGDVGTLSGTVAWTTTGFNWTCKNLTKSVACSATRIYISSCGGDTPSGAGVVTGDNTYLSGHTPTVWEYKATGDLSACEWRCQPGYLSGTNNCIAVEPHCGSANGANYSSTPNTSFLCDPGSTTGANLDPLGCSYTWNCSNLNNSVSCSANRLFSCGGNAPSGDGVEMGNNKYNCADTSTVWEYKANGTLLACQWRCRGGYEKVGNTCEAAGYSDLEMYFLDDVGSAGYVAMMDRNLGATAYMGEDLKSPNDWYGNYYQWGNNYGFPNQGPVSTSSTLVNTSEYGPSPKNYYLSNTFITSSNDWTSDHNNNLWGGNGNQASRKGPCPSGYHMPRTSEFVDIIDNYRKKSADYTSSTIGTQRSLNALMPFAGNRGGLSAAVVGNGTVGAYWTSSPHGSNNQQAYSIGFTSNSLSSQDANYRANAFSVRCLKDSPTPSLTIYPYDGTGALIIVHDNIITKLGTPSRGTDVFEGWYKNYGLTVRAETGQAIPASKTLYAKWRSAECGTASGQSYQTLTDSSQGLCDNGNSVSNFSATTTGFTWKCTYFTSEITCSAKKENYCGGTAPQGDHVLIGDSTYTYPHTPTVWIYTTDLPLTGCQWSCETGYVNSGNRCVTPQEAQCGIYNPDDFEDLDMYFITDTGTTGHYTLMDRNLGATQVYTGMKNNKCTYGYYYQWGNNYGFSNIGSVKTGTTQVNASANGPSPKNYYSSDIFIIGNSDWASPSNDNLWGNNGSESARQGPCPDNYHVPTKDEFVAVVDNYWKKSVNNTAGSWLSSDFLMPFAGYRNYSSAGVNDQGFNGLYWSSSRYNTYFAYYLGCSSTDLNPQYAYDRAVGLSVRCFKNTSDPNLTIHPNGGTGALIIAYNGKIKKLGTPTKAGVTFLGWYSDREAGSRVYENDNVPSSAHLYADWTCTPGQYKANTSCVPCPAGYSCDGDTKTPCEIGSYSSAGAASCTECPEGYTTTGTKSTSVTQCHKRLSVQYYTNGATSIGKTSDGCNAFCTTATNCEDSCGVIAPNITRAGFDILGWNTNQNATNGTTVGGTITLTGDHNSITKYYAITKKVVHGTFLAGVGVYSVNPSSAICEIRNTATSCNIPMATATAICTGGYYGPQWDQQNLDGLSSDVTTTATCTECTGGTTSAVGAMTVDQCVSTQCPAGKYKSGDNCVPCPTHTTSDTGAANVTQCYKVLRGIFVKNGATDIGSGSESCKAYCTDGNCYSLSCTVPKNTITRDGFEILGWSTDGDAISATFTTNQQIILSGDRDASYVTYYYAITKKDVAIRFVRGLGVSSWTLTDKMCTIWNASTQCTILYTTPTFDCMIGYYYPVWDSHSGLTNVYFSLNEDVYVTANCTACPSGDGYYYTSPEGSTVKSQCYIECPPNTYVTGAYGPCVPCTGDTVLDAHIVSGGNTEMACAAPSCATGRYFDYSTKLCTQCPNGYTTDGTGKQYVTQCYKTFTATFNANGATNIGSGSKSCYAYCTTASDCQNSCIITVPSASRGAYWTRVGWSTNPNAHTAMYTVDQPYVTLYEDITFYAITKQECPAGKYSTGGADQCQLCPPGKYNSGTLTAYNTNITSCSDVRCGCYGDSQGATTDCPSSCSGTGQYSLAGATSCSDCSNKPGGNKSFYTTSGGCSNNCQWKCKAGFYYNSSSNDCVGCPDGYTSETGAMEIRQCFVDCPCGSYVRTAQSMCESCGGSNKAIPDHRVYRGKTSASSGYSCKKCTNVPDEGNYQYTGNNCLYTACDWECGKNYYKSGSNQCIHCPNNYYTDGSGSTQINQCKIDCAAGTFLHPQISYSIMYGCLSCAEGEASYAHTKYYTEYSSCTECKNSKPNNASWSGAGTNPNDCKWQCNAGYYLSGSKCRSCVTDYGVGYFSNTGKNYCFELPQCGSANGAQLTSAPSKYLCSVGSDDGITVGHGTWDGSNWNCPAGGCDMNRIAGWSWHCYRIMDGVTYTVSCMAPKKTSCDADCGSAEDGESLKCYKYSSVTCPNTCDGSKMNGYNSKTLTCVDGERKKATILQQTDGTVTTSYTNDSFGDYTYSSCQTENQTLQYTWNSCPEGYAGCTNQTVSLSNGNGGCTSATRKKWDGTSCATNYHLYTENGTKYCKPNARCRNVNEGGVNGGTFANTWSSLAVGPYGCKPGFGVAVDSDGNQIYNAPFNSALSSRYWRCDSFGNRVSCGANKSNQASTSCACQGQSPNRVCCYVGYYGMGFCSRSCSTCGNCN